MDTKFIRLILRKQFIADQGKNLIQEYQEALDKFIYDSGGCTAGWEMQRIDTDKHTLAYICTTEHRDNDIRYLHNVWIETLKNGGPITITDNINISGEISVDFENK